MRTFTPARRSTIVAALMILLLGACADPQAEPAGVSAFGHVHGLGLNPKDGRLYVATHNGLFVVDDGEAQRVGHLEHDLMGFAVVAPNTFLASGHPASGDLPDPMGLVRSDDYGLSWEPVSLVGESDLHSLDVEDDTIAAYDSTASRVLFSKDAGRTFDTLATIEAIDTALLDADTVLVAGTDGVLSLVDDEGSERLEGTPGLAFVDRASQGLAALGPDGQVWVSGDARSWSGRGQLDGVPAALETGGRRWHAATSTGIYTSSDKGASWEKVL